MGEEHKEGRLYTAAAAADLGLGGCFRVFVALKSTIPFAQFVARPFRASV